MSVLPPDGTVATVRPTAGTARRMSDAPPGASAQRKRESDMSAIRILAGCALAAILTSAAGAAFVQVRDAAGGEYPSGNPDGFFLSGTASYNYVYFGASPLLIEYAGTFDFEIDRGEGAGWESLQTYCIQPTNGIPFGKQPGDLVGATYEVRPLADHAGLTPLQQTYTRRLWAHAFDLSTQSALGAAAFQYLLWEFALDDDNDLVSGAFRIDLSDPHTAQAAALAQSWLDLLISDAWTDEVELALLHHAWGQDLLVRVVPGPEGFAIIVIAGLLRQRRRRQVT